MIARPERLVPGERAGSRRRTTAGATRLTVQTLGVLAALAGVEHGVGEIGQGWVTPPALVFRSWEGTAAFGPLNGEPAMTLVPNLLVTGVLTIIVALTVGVWAARYADRRHGGTVMICLSVLLLAVGGGFGPPLLGALAGGLASRIHTAPPPGTGPVSVVLANLWPWPLAATVVLFLALVPGTALLHLAAGTDGPALVYLLTAGAFAAVALAMLSARHHDRAGAAASIPTSIDTGEG